MHAELQGNGHRCSTRSTINLPFMTDERQLPLKSMNETHKPPCNNAKTTMRSWSAQSWAHICIMHLAGMRVHSLDHVLVRGIKQWYAIRWEEEE